MGLTLLSRCDELWCYGDHISRGMRLEINEAGRLGIPVRRVIVQENGFVIDSAKNNMPTETSVSAMRMT